MTNPLPVYVLDTNVFIQAHRRHYAFEICPGFWNFLIHHHEAARIISLDRVRSEILSGDELDTWVKSTAPVTLFSSTADAEVVRNYAEIIRWSQGEAQLKVEAKTEFAQVADGWLCAYARANVNHVIVTHEEFNADAKKRVLIPNVCHQFGIDYLDPFAMLKDLGARFEWSPQD